MKVLTSQVSKYLYIIPFLAFGAFHLMGADGMAEAMNPPLGVAGIYISGLGMILAVVAVIINKYAKLALLLLGVMLLLFVALIHAPATFGGDQMAMGQMLKDLALAGGAWVLADRYEN